MSGKKKEKERKNLGETEVSKQNSGMPSSSSSHCKSLRGGYWQMSVPSFLPKQTAGMPPSASVSALPAFHFSSHSFFLFTSYLWVISTLTHQIKEEKNDLSVSNTQIRTQSPETFGSTTSQKLIYSSPRVLRLPPTLIKPCPRCRFTGKREEWRVLHPFSNYLKYLFSLRCNNTLQLHWAFSSNSVILFLIF